ncbi:MAG: alpha/beta fold hydrolase [Chloroflexi bacterium]|nr:MAG: alpha/beta fold hydrolase [Chloroflexota bacterium]
MLVPTSMGEVGMEGRGQAQGPRIRPTRPLVPTAIIAKRALIVKPIRRDIMTEAKRAETGYIETNGTKLYYEVMGEGHPLVLVHGGYMDRRMWDDQFAEFAQYYRVVRYDVRGFGRSELPQVPYADRQDLQALLTSLGIEKTYLLGLSLGGMIAIDY